MGGMNVETAAEAFQKNVELVPRTQYILKEGKARLGQAQRSGIPSKVKDVCENTLLVEIINSEVSKEQFEDFLADKVILVGEPQSDGDCFDLEVSGCSKVGPRACGNLAFVPPGQSRGFSFHQVSEGSVCVSCYKADTVVPEGQTACNKKDLCDCSNLKDKNSVYDCSIKDVNSTIQIPSYLGGTSRITQRMIYDRVNERRSLTFSSQAYNGFKEMHIIMHAARNGVWQNRQLKLNKMIKIGTQRFVENLEKDVYPYDIARGIQEIKNGNDLTRKNDEVPEYGILIDNGPLSSHEKSDLHPNINKICSDVGVPPRKFRKITVTEKQSDILLNGGPIFLNSDQNFKTVAIAKDGNSGILRFPRTEDDILWTNQILHSVVTGTCCDGSACTTRPGCKCNEIVDQDSFEECLCADGWQKFGGRCFKQSDKVLAWKDAEEECQSWWPGAHLASIHSDEEFKFVQQNFRRIKIWLGGNDIETEGEWVWTDGSEWEFEGWHPPRQPDNAGGNQDCLLGNWPSKDKPNWDDNNCPRKFRFLCKY